MTRPREVRCSSSSICPLATIGETADRGYPILPWAEMQGLEEMEGRIKPRVNSSLSSNTGELSSLEPTDHLSTRGVGDTLCEDFAKVRDPERLEGIFPG
jgi:hypothetical protein